MHGRHASWLARQAAKPYRYSVGLGGSVKLSNENEQVRKTYQVARNEQHVAATDNRDDLGCGPFERNSK